jgi:hypothetical protein
MAFWAARDLDPKRKFRWVVRFTNLLKPDGSPIAEYVAKSIVKPSWKVEATPHKFINHTFNFPGRVTWDPVDLKFADPGGDDDVTTTLYNLLVNSGYANPFNATTAKESITKDAATNSLGRVVIQQLGADESQILETWTLLNCWCTSVSFGDLSYDEEGLTELSMSLIFDWAEYEGPRT